MISSPAELKCFLASLGIKASKHLSQNFLIDHNVIEKIILEAQVQPGERILDIGAGPGALTEALLAHGAYVVAVEKDRKLADALTRFPNVEVYAGDIRDFPLETIDFGKVVANLPFHLTAPILGLLAPRHDLFSTITVVVQEEVARRMVAPPGTRDRSSLSLFLEFYSKPRYAFRISRRCFYPVPKVDSAVVTLTLRSPPQITSSKEFFTLVQTAFQQKRKMLRSSLKSYGLPENEIMRSRPEQLSLEQFLALYISYGDYSRSSSR